MLEFFGDATIEKVNDAFKERYKDGINEYLDIGR